MQKLTLLCFGAAVVVGAVCLLDHGGVFVLFGYLGPAIAGLTLASAVFVRGMFAKGNRRAYRFVACYFALAAIAVAAVRPFPTSPRKRFFLAVEQIKPGERRADVLERLSQYDPKPHAIEHTATYTFQSGAGTADHAIIHFQGDRVAAVEFSAD